MNSSRSLAVISSHPIQYYGPLFRTLAKRVDLHVFFAHRATPSDQARAGFGTAFDWDLDLTSGYSHTFLSNQARRPGTDHFWGCDTPEIGDQLRRRKFDSLLVLGWHLKAYLQGVKAARQLGLPMLVRGDSHLDTPRSGPKRMAKALIYPPFLRVFAAALYVGVRSRAYYEYYGFPESRMFFSPHCVDTTRFTNKATLSARAQIRSSLGIDHDTKVVLFAGKLVPFKRPLDVIAAAAVLQARGRRIAVMVAGAGELRMQVEQTAAASGIPLYMLGFCNQSAMPAAYAAADCLVLPSDARETWGLVANEALACGRPIVVSQACGCAPDLADGVAGKSFRQGDVPALADALDATINSPPRLEDISSVSERYSPHVAAEGVLQALEVVLRRKEAKGL